MTTSTFWIGIIGYGGAALAYGVATILLLVGRPRNIRSGALAAAVAVSCLWASVLLASLLSLQLAPAALLGLDALHLLVWTFCVLCWLGSRVARVWLLGASAAAGATAILASLPIGEVVGAGWLNYPALVLMTLVGLVALEQVYRNAHGEARQQLQLLCLAAGGIVAFDLFVFAHAALLGGLDPLFWTLRGLANAVLAPVLVLGATRQSGWDREPFVSRHVVFYTASLLAVGSYLLAMGVVAYVMRALGREWGVPLDLLFLAAGAAVLFVVLFSAGIRRRLKVFLVKNFYRTKYDYREAWLRLTESLSRTGDLQQSAASGLEGLARIIGSEQGHLWVEREERYEWLVSLANGQPLQVQFAQDHPLIAFLRSTGWVIDSEEYAQAPDRYRNAFGDPADGVLPRNALIVPLQLQGHLQGFVQLGKPAGLRSLNFEDHDILKTAGRQVATVLTQAMVQEKLTETRQFEALSRLSAFLMHDLKNIVAEQELVLANAQRFRHRADFIDDAFGTIRGGTQRIKKVLERLTAASRTRPAVGRVDVSKLLMEVRSQCADRQPVPQIELRTQAVWVRMDRDELASVLLHLIRNAQDATPADGHIKVGVEQGAAGEVVIAVTDTGSGMDGAFIRDRLFRPFDTTKGASGMGIGAYQARHVVRRAGGELEVRSRPGAGTTFIIRLPGAA
ncbi:MAG TPA: XrtA/PEP-CTERM system histidine kinase PrsK [Gammaproteobacteria bacterium]|nr:XrtA/PEP-CTERM system histidine kinase PrsK [Gammaproteobacteria bacterium]